MDIRKLFSIQSIIISAVSLVLAVTTFGLIFIIIKKNKKNIVSEENVIMDEK